MNADERAASHFAFNRRLHGYSRGKIAWDPAYRHLAKALQGSTLPWLDVGCGMGLLAAYLRESGCTASLHGIDPDAAKIALAQKVAARYPGLSFACGDARELPAFEGGVIVLDVLHYLTPDGQSHFLREVASRLAPGGRAYVRTTFRDRSWRYAVTLAEEVFIRAVGWIRGGSCCFPTRAHIEQALIPTGCRVEIYPLWGRTPFNSHMVEIERPQASRAESSSHRA